jgi:hypothetical protein
MFTLRAIYYTHLILRNLVTVTIHFTVFSEEMQDADGTDGQRIRRKKQQQLIVALDSKMN